MKNEKEERLKKKEGVFDEKLIFRLDRPNQNLDNLFFLQNCQNLMYLNVSKNGLKSIREMSKLVNLLSLDISHNKIISLSGKINQGLENSRRLLRLKAEGNLIEDFKGIQFIDNCKELSIVSFENPLEIKQPSNKIVSIEKYKVKS